MKMITPDTKLPLYDDWIKSGLYENPIEKQWGPNNSSSSFTFRLLPILRCPSMGKLLYMCCEDGQWWGVSFGDCMARACVPWWTLFFRGGSGKRERSKSQRTLGSAYWWEWSVWSSWYFPEVVLLIGASNSCIFDTVLSHFRMYI